ncbi:MAG: Epoxyqueuosine reductase, partial [Verrucomicrobiales bacterium]|nr:Epoxyqueuosine reductase [Verrucomicrobiales bacterium]
MTPDPDICAGGVKKLAAALGLADCRIAAIKGPAPHAPEFQAWLDAGHHGSMDWMAKTPHRRKDPREVLPGALAVITVALNYYQNEPALPTAASAASVAAGLAGAVGAFEEAPDGHPRLAKGRIARYAWGNDYHALLDQKLADLCLFLETFGGTQKCYADTGPVLERDWATAAGLGWNGKSTVQIHPRHGCYFFLAEILTTLPLTPDQPMHGHCGSCTRCITACPTQAIIGPHKLDARRCISYLTIEHKTSIPMEFRRAIGDRIYGCDDCLAACPWNRFASHSRDIALAARPYVNQWPLRDFLELTDSTFLALFRHSPIRRIKRPAFLRNVCIALGNVGTLDDLAHLEKAAADPDPLISEHAAWAIQEIRLRLAATPGI